jgi:hypothetical protein
VSLLLEIAPESRLTLPSEEYCIKWMDVLTQFLPGLASRQREVITRLAGWRVWDDMLAACTGQSGYRVDEISCNERLERLASHRSILIHNFKVRPAYANHFLWCNPLGADLLYELNESPPFAIYGADESPSLEMSKILTDLDRHNQGNILQSEESQARAGAFIDAAVHVALCQFLGWDLIIETDAPPVPGLVSVDILGTVRDSELGEVSIYRTGLSRSPNDHYDEPHELLLSWARHHQATTSGPLIVLYSQVLVRNLPAGPISIFGLLVVDGNAWGLPLSASAKNLADYLIEVMASPNLDAPNLFDIDFELARRFAFCKALEHDGMSKDQARELRPTIYVEGSGWGKIMLGAS